MTAEHAHGIDTGGEVCEPKCHGYGVGCGCNPKPRCFAIDPDDIDNPLLTRASAADTVLAEARRLCCGENPSAHHAASAKHSERMAFAGDLARAVRGL